METPHPTGVTVGLQVLPFTDRAGREQRNLGAKRRGAEPGCTRAYRVGLRWWDVQGGEKKTQPRWGLGEGIVNPDRVAGATRMGARALVGLVPWSAVPADAQRVEA